MGKTLTHSFGSAKRDLCTVLNIIVDMSVPLRGTVCGGGCRSYPQLRCFAACSGFLMVGPASRNLAGCVRGRVPCTNKRLYVRLSRNGSRKT